MVSLHLFQASGSIRQTQLASSNLFLYPDTAIVIECFIWSLNLITRLELKDTKPIVWCKLRNIATPTSTSSG